MGCKYHWHPTAMGVGTIADKVLLNVVGREEEEQRPFDDGLAARIGSGYNPNSGSVLAGTSTESK